LNAKDGYNYNTASHVKQEWHSAERISPPRSMIPQNCYC